MAHRAVSLLFITAATLAEPTDTATTAKYDALCEEIITHAQRASKFYNVGDVDAAKLSANEAGKAYRRAVNLAPSEPQAYLHAGTFFYNTHRFDKAVETYQLAAPLVVRITSQAPSGGSWSEYVDGRITAARIGRESKRRDAAYAEGQGNLTKALEAALGQAALAPEAPHFLFDAATISAVLPRPPPTEASDGAGGSDIGETADVTNDATAALATTDLFERSQVCGVDPPPNCARHLTHSPIHRWPPPTPPPPSCAATCRTHGPRARTTRRDARPSRGC